MPGTKKQKTDEAVKEAREEELVAEAFDGFSDNEPRTVATPSPGPTSPSLPTVLDDEEELQLDLPE